MPLVSISLALLEDWNNTLKTRNLGLVKQNLLLSFPPLKDRFRE
jgi:hypothetical protein